LQYCQSSGNLINLKVALLDFFLIGTYTGKIAGVGALATGHIDTVPVADHYGGVLRVLAGIEMVRMKIRSY